VNEKAIPALAAVFIYLGDRQRLQPLCRQTPAAWRLRRRCCKSQSRWQR